MLFANPFELEIYGQALDFIRFIDLSTFKNRNEYRGLSALKFFAV